MQSEYWDLYNQVANRIVGYHKLLLSYSGGLDSSVLLDILTVLRDNNNNNYSTSSPLILRAVYVHHGISDYAEIWGNHCMQQCKIRNIPFYVKYINCLNNTNNMKRNLESIARYLRYQRLFHCLQTGEILLTAHHMDDQVETLLLALKRGSGPAGLAAMTDNMLYNHKYRLLRPLLNCSRMQLEVYARKRKLIWIEDHTNIDVSFDRNFLRVKVLPLLYQRWPCFNKVVTRTAQLCRDQENLLNELLSECLTKLMDTDDFLFFKPLLKYSVPKRQALLRRWLANFFVKMPSYQILNRIWKEVALSRQDAMPILRLNNHFLCRRYREKLYVLPMEMGTNLNNIKFTWTIIIDNIISLPYNLGLLMYQPLSIDSVLLQNTLVSELNANYFLDVFYNLFKKTGIILTHCFIRAPKSDEKVSVHFGYVDGLLYLLKRKRGRYLKKIWKELSIPPWLRSRIPLLFYNNTLIAAIGVFITQEGKVKNKESIVWCVSWVQDILYYKIFQNSIQNDLR